MKNYLTAQGDSKMTKLRNVKQYPDHDDKDPIQNILNEEGIHLIKTAQKKSKRTLKCKKSRESYPTQIRKTGPFQQEE